MAADLTGSSICLGPAAGARQDASLPRPDRAPRHAPGPGLCRGAYPCPILGGGAFNHADRLNQCLDWHAPQARHRELALLLGKRKARGAARRQQQQRRLDTDGATRSTSATASSPGGGVRIERRLRRRTTSHKRRKGFVFTAAGRQLLEQQRRRKRRRVGEGVRCSLSVRLVGREVGSRGASGCGRSLGRPVLCIHTTNRSRMGKAQNRGAGAGSPWCL